MQQLDTHIYVSGQISPADMTALQAAGIRRIINNRPDGEAPGQPSHDDIADAAKGEKIMAYHLPVSQGLSPELIEKARSLYRGSDVPALIYCTSGTRSALLWAFAMAGEKSVDDILSSCAGAGYNLAQYKDALTQFAASRESG